MRILWRMMLAIAFLAGVAALLRLSNDNRQLGKQIQQLEAELGRMTIEDPSQVYLVEIEKPEVPPEVAPHIERMWQFRCYLPANFNFVRINGGGEVTDNGCYMNGGGGSSWSSPSAEATHKLLTVSFQKNPHRLQVYYSFDGSSGTTHFGNLKPELLADGLAIQKLVANRQGARSFKTDTILPLLKIYDPASAKTKVVAGETITVYEGGTFVLCPKSRESEYEQLARGETPVGFDPNSIAKMVSDE